MDIFDAVQGDAEVRARVAVARAEGRAAELGQRVTELEGRLNRLALVSHALWDMLKERHGYTEEELRDWITLTDLKDGQLDGRVRPTSLPDKCPSCARVVTRTLARCLYCGEAAPAGDAFDRVH